MPLATIIIPCYNEALNLKALYQRLRDAAADTPGYDFEFLFVDDGSTDETFDKLSRLSKLDPRVKAIRFSRNFGSHAACLAGLTEANGDSIAFLAADLQDPPELIPSMLAKLRAGFEVVFAVRSGRRDPWLTVKAADIYNGLLRRYAIPGWPMQGADVFAITRAVRDVVVKWRQKNTSIFAQIFWSGFRQASISYLREQRRAGLSKWTFRKKLKLLVDAFVSFSFSPVRLISCSGVALAAVGASYGSLELLKTLLGGAPAPAWAWIVTVVLIVSGLQLVALGVIGEYLWRVADEVRGAPPYIVESRLGEEAAQPVLLKFQREQSVRILRIPEGQPR